tara:strand:+ start:100 stop:435 length:336 start_codon:yes stop_codon:yes gene_type:complete
MNSSVSFVDDFTSDIWENIAMHSSFDDAISLCQVCKSIVISDYVFQEFAYKERGQEFWRKASNRPSHKSRPLPTFKLELLRIREFLKICQTHQISNEYFYGMWDFLDFPVK